MKLLLEDMGFPESLRLASEAVFAERKGKENYIDYEVKVYKGKDIDDIKALSCSTYCPFIF